MMQKVCLLLIIGVLLSTTIMAQKCPAVPGESVGTCTDACSDDDDCKAGELCCGNGCGHECMSPVVDPCAAVHCAALNCSELSAGTITPEGECCPVCACTATDGSMVAAGTSFMNDCNTCFCGSTGIAGCTLIACSPTTKPPTPGTPGTPPATPGTPPATPGTPPATPATPPATPGTPPATPATTGTTVTDATLPTPSPPVMCPNTSGLIGTCDEQCSSDDECSNGQLCCSNGCGHDCMDPVMDCSAVLCLRPNCTSLSVLVTPEGSCCPVCGCQTPDGDRVAPGETYPDRCNTCTCIQNGLAACTEAFCPPPTNSTATPSVGPTEPTCPVKGQVRVDCATSCVITCANMNTLQVCTESCQLNGCQCPQGSVINEEINTCVRPSDCNSTTVRTCPTVQSTNEENCVDECSSDDDCQYNRICCSNGCGGRVCSDSVEMCQMVFCDIPICEDDALPVTSPFSCCPFCPPTTTQNCSVTKVTGRVSHNQRRQRTRLRFTSDGDSTVAYKCKLDDGNFEDCKSPMVWRNLERGRHTIIVRALCSDDEGKRSTSARRKFRVRVR